MLKELADLHHKMEQAAESGNEGTLVRLTKKYLATWREAWPTSQR